MLSDRRAGEAARAALEHIELDRDDLKQEVAEATNAILIEVAKVVLPVGEELLARAKRAPTEFLGLYQTIAALTGDESAARSTFASNVAEIAAAEARRAPLATLRAEVFKLNLATSDWLAAKSAAAPSLEWRGRLRQDPDAPRPDAVR
jgi:hypothetical protein